GSSSYVAGDFKRGFDGICACWSGELDNVFHFSWTQDEAVESFQERAFCFRVKVKAVGDAVAFDIVDKCFFEDRVVVSIVETARAAQKIEIGISAPVVDMRV